VYAGMGCPKHVVRSALSSAPVITTPPPPDIAIRSRMLPLPSPLAAVTQVAFDPLDAGPNSQGPAVLYCTAGGRLCRASLNSSSDAGAGLSSGDALVDEPYGIASFDPAPVVGGRSSGLLVALAGEQVCLVPRDTEPQVGGW
jgi:hypothetical protein